MSTQAVIKASELQRSSGKVLKRAAVSNEHLVIERAGYPVAVMISFQEYEALMRDRALAVQHDLVRTLGREAEQEDMDEAALMADLEAEKQRLFQENYGG
ncbi:MAG: type II toxin-antitoxin system Phd/YefM family antitoxin, partial [Chloroflexi bacterium]|nr:type II toxin-antitoxin system Phd/YefM family antitoxin [Chloroflexota bacterium]